MLRDIWNHKDVAITNGGVTVALNTHQSMFAVFDNITDVHWWGPNAY